MSTLKIHAVNTLKWSLFSFGYAVFIVLCIVASGWVSFQLLVFLIQY